ncbi:hypothetical protein SAMN05421747_101502 [Parapedobacter composti]|uniref:Uncharacterized protein n=1 Tax=Parapedobacter composti TaxID=623281 RepID=A0A1I1EDV3_9SPHI|nr:hypothetical protein SAMN05421747_101502 [Parapedobacter composti]
MFLCFINFFSIELPNDVLCRLEFYGNFLKNETANVTSVTKLTGQII